MFSSADIDACPFQIAAAHFVLKSPYQKGIILCDESGMGKTHEAMLVVTQRFIQGQNKILIAIPNSDLLVQWLNIMGAYEENLCLECDWTQANNCCTILDRDKVTH